MRILKILNILLIIAAILLIINLICPIDTIMGNVIYSLDKSEPRCYFMNAGISNEIPINNCCYELYNQLACEQIKGESDFSCYVSKTSGRYYLVNKKAIDYCQKEGFDIEIK